LIRSKPSHRVTKHHTVEPPRPAAATRDRAELATDLDQRVAVLVEQLGRERSRPDAGRVGLGDPDDPVDVARAETRARAGASGGRIRRGDVRVGAVVEVEEGRLRSFEQHVRAVGERAMEETDRVGDVWSEPATEGAERLDDVIDVEGFAARLFEQRVLGESALADERREAIDVEDVAGAEADPARLVGVRRTDPLERRADLVVAAHRLGDRIVGLVPREDEVRSARHLQVVTADTARLERVDLGEQRGQVDDDPVGDDGDDVVVEDSRRDELQCVPLAVDHHGVAGVVPALIPHDVGVLLRQQVDDLGFALVTPLGSDDDGDGHARSL
jgi:hypothetical protein